MTGRQAQFGVILALVLLVVLAAAALVYLSREEAIQQTVQDAKGMAISSAVTLTLESCLEKALLDADAALVQRGSWYQAPELRDEASHAPFVFSRGEDYLPTYDDVRASFESSVTDTLPSCLSSLAAFEDQGVKISQGQPQLSVVFAREDLAKAQLKLPLHIAVNGNSVPLTDFSASAPVTVPGYVGLLFDMHNSRLWSNTSFCLACVNEFSEENDVEISVVPKEENVYLVKMRHPGDAWFTVAVRTKGLCEEVDEHDEAMVAYCGATKDIT